MVLKISRPQEYVMDRRTNGTTSICHLNFFVAQESFADRKPSSYISSYYHKIFFTLANKSMEKKQTLIIKCYKRRNLSKDFCSRYFTSFYVLSKWIQLYKSCSMLSIHEEICLQIAYAFFRQTTNCYYSENISEHKEFTPRLLKAGSMKRKHLLHLAYIPTNQIFTKYLKLKGLKLLKRDNKFSISI